MDRDAVFRTLKLVSNAALLQATASNGEKTLVWRCISIKKKMIALPRDTKLRCGRWRKVDNMIQWLINYTLCCEYILYEYMQNVPRIKSVLKVPLGCPVGDLFDGGGQRQLCHHRL